MEPLPVREVELAWIPMADGTRLAARLWLPETAEPVPAILEYVPYRRRDSYRERDNVTHSWFAGQGYACLRVDIRGTGDSDGVIRDEYLKQEHDDGVEVIAWIARQPWCSGSVGMMGLSWGGFNALQIAARRPPALKAIITAYSTDDRYADDVHYMGGCITHQNMFWGANFFARMARSPDPLMVGEERWRAMFRERLEGWEPPFIAWLEHQTRDAFWKHGSVCENYADITCAVFAVGGWADAYSNSVFRLLQRLGAPRIGIVGPWGHEYPHRAVPGPRIGFLQEAKRWWDHWLKGQDTGIMREPMLRAWMQDSVPPASYYDDRPGTWVGESAWPPPGVREVPYGLGRDRLHAAGEADDDAVLTIASPQHVGQHGGDWCGFGSHDLPLDQREEDSGSLVFDSEILRNDQAILGAAVVELEFAVDRPAAMVAIRLNDVRPDGSVLRVTYGIQNLTHRDGHEHPEALEPGRRYRLRIPLNEVGEVIPAGHRLRLAISTAYWPIIWPSPEPVTLTVFCKGSRLLLPLRAPRPEDSRIRFEPAALGRPTPVTVIEPAREERRVTRDVVSGEVVNTRSMGIGRMVLDEIATEIGIAIEDVYRIHPDDPTTARHEQSQVFVHRRGDWDVVTNVTCALGCTAREFLVEATLDVREGGKPFFLRSWLKRIPRQGV